MVAVDDVFFGSTCKQLRFLPKCQVMLVEFRTVSLEVNRGCPVIDPRVTDWKASSFFQLDAFILDDHTAGAAFVIVGWM